MTFHKDSPPVFLSGAPLYDLCIKIRTNFQSLKIMEVIKSHRKRNIMSGIVLAFSYLFTTDLSDSRPSLTSESKMQSYFFDSDYYIHTPVKF